MVLFLFRSIPLDYKLSMMEEVNLRFQHISEQIFGCLDNKSLANCKEVCRSWNNFLDGQKFLHSRIILETVTKVHKVEKSWLQVFKKSNTKIILDLKIAVEHVYKGSGILTSYKEQMSWLEVFKISAARNQFVSPLHVTAAFGQLTLFDDILHRVQNKFPIDGLGRSILHYAAINDHLNIFESIVDINGNISTLLTTKHTNSEIPTPMGYAVIHNSLKVCKFIVENDLDQILLDNTSGGQTFLHTAALFGHIELYKMILEKVADKIPLHYGYTPLHFAAGQGHLEMCRLILENVNDKSPVDANGQTPKEVAEEFNNLEIVKLFT